MLKKEKENPEITPCNSLYNLESWITLEMCTHLSLERAGTLFVIKPRFIREYMKFSFRGESILLKEFIAIADDLTLYTAQRKASRKEQPQNCQHMLVIM